MPTSLATATERHYRGKLYRYRVSHFDLNRESRRAYARRDPHSKKLMTEPSSNVPLVHSVVSNA